MLIMVLVTLLVKKTISWHVITETQRLLRHGSLYTNFYKILDFKYTASFIKKRKPKYQLYPQTMEYRSLSNAS